MHKKDVLHQLSNKATILWQNYLYGNIFSFYHESCKVHRKILEGQDSYLFLDLWSFTHHSKVLELQLLFVYHHMYSKLELIYKATFFDTSKYIYKNASGRRKKN